MAKIKITKTGHKAVVVTTEAKGVFFGYGPEDIPSTRQVVLQDARMCVYWDTTTRGVLGLAAAGPNSKCRVTNKVPRIALVGVTAIMLCTPEATGAWESGPWA